MIDESLLRQFLEQFDGLIMVVEKSAARVVQEPADDLFYNHQNVFIKSYLVSACSMLEAFIQDLAEAYLNVLQARINAANLPYNLVMWIAQHEKAKLSFEPFLGNKTKKNVSDLISPNYYLTIKAFEKLGVDLSESEIRTYKDFVSSIVEKRNKIVHHNDEASDLSFADIVSAVNEFKAYAICLFNAVCSDRHLICVPVSADASSGNV